MIVYPKNGPEHYQRAAEILRGLSEPDGDTATFEDAGFAYDAAIGHALLAVAAATIAADATQPHTPDHAANIAAWQVVTGWNAT